MENKVIAQIKLNPGKGGYFDPISRIHLTHGNPFADVYAGTNTTGLKQAVYNKRISLISGSLGVIEPPFKLVKGKDGRMVLVPNKGNEKVEVQKAKEVKVKTEQPKVEEPKVEEVVEVKEEIIEETTPEVVEETTEEVKEEVVEEVSEEIEEIKEDEEPSKKKKNKKKKKSEE